MPMHDEPRAWATIPEAAKALRMNRQTIRNQAEQGEIAGALREPGGQKQWRIPGQWICEQAAVLRGLENVPRGVRIARQRKVRGRDEYKTITTTIWRTDEIADAEGAAISGVPEPEVVK